MEYLFKNFSVFEWCVFFIAAFAFLVQCFYYLVIYSRVSAFNKQKYKFQDKQEPVSVVICARNEAENLTTFLPLILEQDYPNYEVVVVNDCSDDHTQHLLEDFQIKYPHLRITQIKHDEKFTHGKKLALTIGIKAAKNEWLLLTDADCKPVDKHWISSMQRNFTPDTDIVLGYGGYLQEKGFVNKLIRFDTFFIALQYLSFALVKMPYMGVGRNLAYRKSLFLKNKGFASHAHIVSGDDDLFINEVATSKNTRVEFDVESQTRSIPKETFFQWKNQKQRHLTAGAAYKLKHKLILGFELFSRLIFYLAIIALFISPAAIIIGALFFFVRVIMQILVFNSAMEKFDEKKILLFSILFDIILPLLNLFLYSVSTMNSKRHRWK